MIVACNGALCVHTSPVQWVMQFVLQMASEYMHRNLMRFSMCTTCFGYSDTYGNQLHVEFRVDN